MNNFFLELGYFWSLILNFTNSMFKSLKPHIFYIYYRNSLTLPKESKEESSEYFISSLTLHCFKKIDFPRYNMKCSGKNVILRGICHVVSRFPLNFMLYHGNMDCFSNSVIPPQWCIRGVWVCWLVCSDPYYQQQNYTSKVELFLQQGIGVKVN